MFLKILSTIDFDLLDQWKNQTIIEIEDGSGGVMVVRAPLYS